MQTQRLHQDHTIGDAPTLFEFLRENIEYLTRWTMLLAGDRLVNSADSIA